MTSSVGMMKFPIYMETKMFQTTNQRQYTDMYDGYASRIIKAPQKITQQGNQLTGMMIETAQNR
jgi:hypothetical protein